MTFSFFLISLSICELMAIESEARRTKKMENKLIFFEVIER